MAFLDMRNITKRFPGVLALDKVEFEAEQGEIHAIVGQNGAGKSTLMKILGGAYNDYEGEIYIDGKPVKIRSPKDSSSAGIAVIYQELNLVPHMTVAENIFLGREPTKFFGFIDFNKMKEEAKKILAELDPTIDPEAKVRDLPVGKQQLTEIAKALSQKARILIMDEPTSALTEAETLKLYDIIRKLKAQRTTILYVSHRLREVFTISDRITVLRDGRKIGTVKTNDADPRQVVAMMVGREVEEFEPHLPPEKFGTPALEVRNLVVVDRMNAQKRLLDVVSLQVRKGEVVGIFGLLGAGRSELLLTLFGASPGIIMGGEVFLEGKPVAFKSPMEAIQSGVGLVTEDRKTTGLILTMTAGHNISLAALKKFSRFQFVKRSSEEQAIWQAYQQLNIQPPMPSMPVVNLSGGNQQKVLLSRWLLVKPKVLLLDEPTRGVDIGARAELYRFIRHLAHDEGVAILFSSSELPEVLALADRILVMHQGRIVAEFPTNTPEEQIMFYATGGHLAKGAA
ncbi:MAG: sugar ABC transporter ATP-binding protein [Armatimonadetes bacterium]|nr:sugar ABC transporter ATP-binding protein [Armatimonadota bacterium]MDW8028469.1 sugar ABC transporter ATP-binding protein [Armatimonadota bacterium]